MLPALIEPVAKPLEAEFKYFLNNQDELVAKYRGKFVVIKDGKVLDAYDTQLQAVETTSKTHQIGTFLVQQCEPGSDVYTQTFHSRVAFAA